MFDSIRKFARYDIGSPKVFYAFNVNGYSYLQKQAKDVLPVWILDAGVWLLDSGAGQQPDAYAGYQCLMCFGTLSAL